MAAFSDTKEAFRASEPVIYKDKDDVRVPGVTTVQGKFQDPGGLMHWSWQQGVRGLDYRTERDRLAGAGTVCHKMVENYLLGADADAFLPTFEDLGVGEDEMTEVMRMAENGFDNFQAWWIGCKGVVEEVEISMVDDELGFGGTMDIVVSLWGSCLFAIDLKTSKKMYHEHMSQLAAYRYLWMHGRLNKTQRGIRVSEPRFFNQPLHGGIVLRVDREEASFGPHVMTAESMDIAFKRFKNLLAAYKLIPEMNRIADGSSLIELNQENCERIEKGEMMTPKKKRKTRKKKVEIK